MTYQILTKIHGRARDISGESFGRLTAIAIVENRNHVYHWLCICECGSDVVVRTASLVSGNTKSCGCLSLDVSRNRFLSHGLSDTREYNAWKSMQARCNSQGNASYSRYGGRGISVCERWESLENFILDMGKHPGEGYSIDRIDNDGDYTPENCRWATRKEQTRNMKTNRMLKLGSETLCVAEWADRIGVYPNLIHNRLQLGWSDEKALTEKVRKW